MLRILAILMSAMVGLMVLVGCGSGKINTNFSLVEVTCNKALLEPSFSAVAVCRYGDDVTVSTLANGPDLGNLKVQWQLFSTWSPEVAPVLLQEELTTNPAGVTSKVVLPKTKGVVQINPRMCSPTPDGLSLYNDLEISAADAAHQGGRGKFFKCFAALNIASLKGYCNQVEIADKDSCDADKVMQFAANVKGVPGAALKNTWELSSSTTNAPKIALQEDLTTLPADVTTRVTLPKKVNAVEINLTACARTPSGDFYDTITLHVGYVAPYNQTNQDSNDTISFHYACKPILR